jgi:hypothetical protein
MGCQRMRHALQHQLLLTPYAGSSGNSSVLHCGIMPHAPLACVVEKLQQARG